MKSTRTQLKSRGYCGKTKSGKSSDVHDCSRDELIQMLRDANPVTRTAAASALTAHKCSETISSLCELLVSEQKLYPRLAVCETLVSFGKESARPLAALLGTIGDNRHNAVPTEIFRKKSYPLQRDLAARTIARIGKDALPVLTEILDQGELSAAREAIDAVGYICFYDPHEEMFDHVAAFARRNAHDDVSRWKTAIALRAFRSAEAAAFAADFFADETNEIIRKEADLSLGRNND